MPNNPAEIYIRTLEGALRLIQDRSHWTSVAAARDATGRSVSPTSPEACQWCAGGALVKSGYRAHPTDGPEHLWHDLDRLLNEQTHRLYPDMVDYVCLNDYLGHAAILKVMRATLKYVKTYLTA